MARLAAGLLVVLALLLLPAAPAAAHPSGIQPATDYLTRVTGVAPALPGITARYVNHGSRLELRTDGSTTVQVLGYAGEPMFEVRPDGAWQNTRSPSLYVDAQPSAEKARADATAAAEWQRVSESTVIRWPDHRALWHGAPPPAVAAKPDHPVHLSDWAVPLRVGGAEARITGTLDWLPPPDTSLWWTVVVALALAVGAIGLLPAGWRSSGPLIGVAVVTGAAAVGYGLVVAGTSATGGIGGFAAEAAGEILELVTGLAVLAAALFAVFRRAAADLAFAIAGACVALVVGLNNAPVFSHAVTPTPYGTPARFAIAAVLAGGLGLTVAGAIQLRRDTRRRLAVNARRVLHETPGQASGS